MPARDRTSADARTNIDERARRLVPGEVVELVGDDDVVARTRAGYVVRAELAVPGYRARVGDRVLVSASEDGAYVLGVLGEARRRPVELAGGKLVAMHREGEGVVLESLDGALSLQAERVAITSSDVAVTAGRITTRVERLIEEAGTTHRRARDVAELVAGRTRTIVEGACEVHAERTTLTSSGDTIVDGARVLLG